MIEKKILSGLALFFWRYQGIIIEEEISMVPNEHWKKPLRSYPYRKVIQSYRVWMQVSLFSLLSKLLYQINHEESYQSINLPGNGPSTYRCLYEGM